MTAVAPVRLAAHLTLASGILAGLVWLAAGLDRPAEAPLPAGLRRTARALPALVLLQIALGGLVAGSKAGLTYNTWPLMDGAFIPPLDGLFAVRPLIENVVDNVALVQLDHRLVAYAVLALAVLHAIAFARARPGSPGARRARALAGLVAAQAVLGITTLVLAVPLWAGLAHQVLAMLVLGMAVVHARIASLGPARLPAAG